MKSATVVIRKYGNRRLYDTSSSRYINLDDIAAMVRKGADVQVLDAKTGEDLTRVTLTQIILEDAKGRPASLPLELLRQLVVATDEAGREFVMWYLKSAFNAYGKVQDALHSGLNEVGSAALSPLDAVRSFLGGSAPRHEGADEVARLRRRVADLESRAGKPKKRRKAAR